ncbi:MAG: hypothetical protein H6581_14585 [Bacteroidia bacterium]|nr:hypothetical protein [Bacteroidia bacterium]
MELKQFMVEVSLPNVLSPKFISLIPKQRAMINKLVNQGKISSYTLALDRSKLWSVFVAESEKEVEDILNRWPIIEFMDYEIYDLFFHEMAANALPAISLN